MTPSSLRSRGQQRLSFSWLAMGTLGFGLVGGVGACQPRAGFLPTGPHIPQKEPAPIRVRRPPPPVQIEAIPLRRNQECFYRDGAWTPSGSSWKWVKGEWLLPPPGCYYAKPTTRYEDIGVGAALVYRPGYFHPNSGSARCDEPKECPPAGQK